MKDWISAHRCHDYPHLIERWRRMAKGANLYLRPFSHSGGYRLYYLRTKKTPARAGLPWIYISAGVHGDEPAGCEALLQWIEAHPDHLERANFLLFPCLNPWGLVNNRRSTEDHLDLNRAFHLKHHRVVQSWRELVGGYRFELALCLHEDFDAQGTYLYEVSHEPGGEGIGRRILQSAADVVSIDPRPRIEGRKAVHGVIRPRNIPERMKQSMPEALHLHEKHSRYTLTLETPSEYGLHERCAALAKLTASAIDLVIDEL